MAKKGQSEAKRRRQGEEQRRRKQEEETKREPLAETIKGNECKKRETSIAATVQPLARNHQLAVGKTRPCRFHQCRMDRAITPRRALRSDRIDGCGYCEGEAHLHKMRMGKNEECRLVGVLEQQR